MSFFSKEIGVFGNLTKDNFLGNKNFDECCVPSGPCDTIDDCFTGTTFGTWVDANGNSGILTIGGSLDIEKGDPPGAHPNHLFEITPDSTIVDCLLGNSSITGLSISVLLTNSVIISEEITDGSTISLTAGEWGDPGEYVISLSITTSDCTTDYHVTQELTYITI